MANHTGILTEADTCRELVTPKLLAAGWGNAPHAIGEQRSFTHGRIIIETDCATDIAAYNHDTDIKRPNIKTELEHANPKDLIASMRSHEAEVMRPLEEITILAGEVQT